MEYQALFEPAEEGGFVVTFPDIKMGATQGDSEAAAQIMAEDFLITVLSFFIEKGEPLPLPRVHRGKRYRSIGLPALTAAKLRLYQDFLKSGIRKAELARRTGIGTNNIDRLFDLQRNTRLDHIEAAFAALGKELRLDVQDNPKAAVRSEQSTRHKPPAAVAGHRRVRAL